ncbi:MAG TPA: DNA primase [Solirubrobacteraceae bacterium]|jgi:DNA primase
MALYTRESRDLVRDAVDFIELVSAKTELRRAGPSNYEGLCPFHEERTPSFGIDPNQKVYYCFGCQASGDIFTFVQETEGVDFKGALEMLAQRTGVELELEQENPEEMQKRRRRERLLELLSRTTAFYERMLWESDEAAPAREYLTGRGIDEAALRQHGVGYAPSAWDRVLRASLNGGYSEAELRAVGLVQRSREGGRPFDRFRGRIMFPLADVRGNVLGFGARVMPGRDEERRGEGAETQRPGPKYLNTSETEVFHKGRHLYSAHIARSHAARIGSVILCEGYTDVIALHQAGIMNVVGLMGTALTELQLAELARMAPTVLLALDADTAGQGAMLKAAEVAKDRKLELRAVRLPGGLDPADLIQQQGAEAMRAAVETSVPFVRFRVEQALASGDDGTPEGRDRILDELRPLFATLPASALRLDLTRLVAGRLALPESLIDGALGEQAPRRSGPSQSGRSERERSQALPAAAQASGVSSRRRQVEQAFLSLCLASPDLGRPVLEQMRPQEHFTDGVLRAVAEHLRSADLRNPMQGVQDSDPELAHALTEIVIEAGRGKATEAMLRVSALQLELGYLDRMIQAARVNARIESSDSEAQSGLEVSELARRRADVKRDFDTAQELALQESPT